MTCLELIQHKKVLLRERKRHTTRRVAGTRSSGLFGWGWGGGGGYPSPRQGVPYPSHVLAGRYPSQGPCPQVSLPGTWYPLSVLGYPQLGLGYQLGKDQGAETRERTREWGTPTKYLAPEILESTWDQRPGKEPETRVPLVWTYRHLWKQWPSLSLINVGFSEVWDLRAVSEWQSGKTRDAGLTPIESNSFVVEDLSSSLRKNFGTNIANFV